MQIAPMLDMAFQLLTFFILTYHPLPTEGQFVMNLLPPQPATAINAEAPTDAAASDKLPASLRTLPTVLKAGPGGSLAEISVGEQTIPTDSAALEKELDKYLAGPDPAVRPDPAQGRPQPQILGADEGDQRVLQRLQPREEAA